VVLDPVHMLCAASGSISQFCSSIVRPNVALLVGYHTDVASLSPSATSAVYAPSDFTILKYLSTTVLTIHSSVEVFERKKAADRALTAPQYGLALNRGGTLIHPQGKTALGYVLEMEYRRPSGRPICEVFFVPYEAGAKITPLVEHPVYSPPKDEHGVKEGETAEDSTFLLGLTAQQQRDRAEVVLPYFDAQKGNIEGGRILYEMSREDDFDEEEDEI
jgi:elongator complex protein 5